MFEATIQKTFAAAHLLKEVGGKCESLHGHNYRVEVTVSAERLNEEGLVVDFRLLKGWTQEVLEKLDHHYLNEIDYFRDKNPSAEQIARFIFEGVAARLAGDRLHLSCVTVWESDDARVIYRGGPR